MWAWNRMAISSSMTNDIHMKNHPVTSHLFWSSLSLSLTLYYICSQWFRHLNNSNICVGPWCSTILQSVTIHSPMYVLDQAYNVCLHFAQFTNLSSHEIISMYRMIGWFGCWMNIMLMLYSIVAIDVVDFSPSPQCPHWHQYMLTAVLHSRSRIRLAHWQDTTNNCTTSYWFCHFYIIFLLYMWI